ncbi:hypothetical protein EKK58_07360 [Candidatus Dependentiae bacterium]|nr:MAG: hypothetical protein EKK58_07360 [Candidatus Dependentiae bacterium]
MIRCPKCLSKFKLGEDQDDIVFCPSCLYVFKLSSVNLAKALDRLSKDILEALCLKEILTFLDDIINEITLKITRNKLWKFHYQKQKLQKELKEKNKSGKKELDNLKISLTGNREEH